jgi:hypothetical protein
MSSAAKKRATMARTVFAHALPVNRKCACTAAPMSHRKDDAMQLHARIMIRGDRASCPYAALHARRPSSAATQYAWNGTIRSEVWRCVIKLVL